MATVIELAGITLPSPVMVASGCGGTGRELAAYADLSALGGFVTRSITVNPRTGGPVPRIVETPSGLVNAIGLQNPGLDHFLATELPWLVQQGARVFVSIAGKSLGEYAELARRLGRSPGVAGIEVNLSAPDATGTHVFDVREPFHAASVVSAVQRDLPRGMPALAKLRPDVGRVVESARTVLDAGAAAVVVGNAVPAAMPDGRPAGLSGPAIRPLSLRCVTEVAQSLPEAQVVGAGGIGTVEDVRSFLAAGATAVQVGTALLRDPTTAARLVAELDEQPDQESRPGSRQGERMTETFGARLHAALGRRGQLCAGIDPHASLLTDWGLPDDVAGLEKFALTVVEAVAPVVPVVKPQSAFYERFGSRGIAVLERVIAESRAAGALVLLDVKRGDIGSTSQAYADAYLDPASPLAADAITASPFLGFGSLDPMLDTARRHGAGVFVLALTSNKEGPEVQHATAPDGRSVGGAVLDRLRTLNQGADPLGSFGAVVGATIGETTESFAINGPLLAPGYGAQGGTVADLRRIFGTSSGQVLASTSRDLLRLGPDTRALREGARRLGDELAELA